MVTTPEKKRSTSQAGILRCVLSALLAPLLCLTGYAQDPAAPPGNAAAPAEPETVPAPATAEDADVVEVITFHQDAGKLYTTMEEAADLLAWTVTCECKTRDLLVNGVIIPKEERRRFTNGTELLSMEALTRAGAEVNVHPSGLSATIHAGERQFTLMRADKRVEVSIGDQRLRAWQGSRLVLETNVSTGRKGNTPSGNFSAGPYRSRMHRSRLYHNAPMPWSVQINGHIFIHGFSYVPEYPASHGCIRVPLDKGNPARFIYEWVDSGTPVTVLPAPPKVKKSKLTKK